MTDHANMLRQAAAEMRHYGHDGWPNVCDWGADELDRLNAQALELCAEISGLRRENESMRHDLGVLRGHHHEGCMAEIERLREENNVLSAREARAENSALHLGALVDELRGLLRDINSRPRHLNAGAWEIRLYQDDYDRIDAALEGAADQPSASLRCQSEASVILRSIRGDIEAAYNGLDYLTSIHVATAADPNGGRNLARDAAEIKGRLLQHMKRIDAVVTSSTVPASEVPVEESAACEIERANRVYGRGAHTLMALMQAYERRVRSDCTSQADIDARPWECAEYRAAADYLRKTWPRAADPERVEIARCSRCGGLLARVVPYLDRGMEALHRDIAAALAGEPATEPAKTADQPLVGEVTK